MDSRGHFADGLRLNWAKLVLRDLSAEGPGREGGSDEGLRPTGSDDIGFNARVRVSSAKTRILIGADLSNGAPFLAAPRELEYFVFESGGRRYSRRHQCHVDVLCPRPVAALQLSASGSRKICARIYPRRKSFGI